MTRAGPKDARCCVPPEGSLANATYPTEDAQLDYVSRAGALNGAQLQWSRAEIDCWVGFQVHLFHTIASSIVFEERVGCILSILVLLSNGAAFTAMLQVEFYCRSL